MFNANRKNRKVINSFTPVTKYMGGTRDAEDEEIKSVHVPKTPKPFKQKQLNGNSLFRNKTTVSEFQPPRHISCQLIKLNFPEQDPVINYDEATPFLAPDNQEIRVSVPKSPNRRSYGLIDKKPYDDITTCIDILKQGIVATKYHYTKSN